MVTTVSATSCAKAASCSVIRIVSARPSRLISNRERRVRSCPLNAATRLVKNQQHVGLQDSPAQLNCALFSPITELAGEAFPQVLEAQRISSSSTGRSFDAPAARG